MMDSLPVVGSKGFYEFATPFDKESTGNVEYECMAVRRISDYLADNKDPKKDIYEAWAIESTLWEEDVVADAYIVSLRTNSGHWLYIPARYITAYPSVNGVEYRSVMIGISMPSLPVAQDLSALLGELRVITESTLGVTCAARLVETSKVVMVPFAEHEGKVQARAAASGGQTNVHARLTDALRRLDTLQQRNAILEQYILDNQ